MPRPLLNFKFSGKNLRVFQKAPEQIRALEGKLINAAKKVIREIGQEAVEGLRRQIQHGRPEWKPLSPVTIQVRRRRRTDPTLRRQPWKDTGHLQRHIKRRTVEIGKNRQDVTVGVVPGVQAANAIRGSRPISLSRVVSFHERGRSPISVTKKMSRFFRALSGKGSPRPGRSILASIQPGIELETPTRPLFGPYFQENKERFKKKYADALNAVVKDAARHIPKITVVKVG